MPHYTTANDDAFISKITFDFVAQLEHRLEISGSNQTELAQKLNVTESAVSQVLNCNRANLHLKTMVKYARALGLKVAIVAYDDRDPQNENGPVGSEIFSQSWEKFGRPRDVWSVNEAGYAANRCLFTTPVSVSYGITTTADWSYNWANSASPHAFSGTNTSLPLNPVSLNRLPEEANTAAYA